MLTDAQIRSAKRAEKPRKISDGGGLHLLVAPSGGRYWRYNYRFDGKQKTLALGVYPDVSLAMARGRHQHARQLLADGIDPGAQRETSTKTFEVVAREWHTRWKANRHERHAYYVLRRLEADVFPEIGSSQLSDLTVASFRDTVRKIEDRGALDIAKRVLNTCGQIMRYAIANDLTAHNPVAGIKPADILKPRKHRNYARIDAADLPELLHAVDGYVGSEHTRLALQLMALTFVRTSELIGARWTEIDEKEARWNIPAERMKMKTPHIVPLSKQALAVLKKLREISFDRELVFPGDLNSAKPMSNNTLLFALYRLGYRGRMTGHGFRGVASTILHEQGWPHEHIELQLAHQERNAVSAAFNHALYLKPRAEMMQAWADHLDALRRGYEAKQRAQVEQHTQAA
ncbi:MAG TPA: integrase arm-type DNA-binding domain-containing protein [Steroidobacteraceae bacterium]|nr:integrase arm-type DNA-binding domain-containing protein [Steroidobacteraceae bacterium]